MIQEKECRILSVDAWRDIDGCWTWNQWFYVEQTISIDCLNWSSSKLLKYLRNIGVLSTERAGKVAVDDDQYNLVIIDKNTRRPLYAIEYGNLM